jgi:uncharacterized protein YifN (PemK superfamily)
MDNLQAATLIAALTSQLYVYCWFGSELTQQVSTRRLASTKDLVTAQHPDIYLEGLRKTTKYPHSG